MEGRPERITDYFVVVGLGRNVTQFEQFPLEDVDVPQLTGEPITDLAVVFRKQEVCPKGYRCLETTPSGHSANLNAGHLFGGPIHLCYRQGRDRPPITDISVFYGNQHQQLPLGYEPLAFSVGGRPADLNRGGRTPTYLTFKRGVLFGHCTALTGLCLISKGENPPPGYKLLRTDLNKGLIGPSLFLAYRTSLVRPSSVAYTPELITRYPLKDYPEFPLPESVPLFCMPFGVSVEHWDRRAPYPFPTFLTFALTSAHGQCMYGAVVMFYEQVPEDECRPEMKETLGVGEEEVLHMSKCVCLLSHWPFFSAFKAFLSALYRLSVSRNIPLPLERYIGNLMINVPFPTMERPRVQMQIGNEFIVFSLPVQTPLPLSVSTHCSLLSSLDPDNCCTLISLLLLEQKVVLHSSRPALLTGVGEALRSVLFPFSWQCTYIPMCPLAFSSYMQAPVPFIIGIDSQYFDVFEKPGDVCVVDLDSNFVTLSKEAKTLLEQRPAPSKPIKALKQTLRNLAIKVRGLNPGTDFAVEVAPLDFGDTQKGDLETVDVEIREAFLRFNATILKQYRSCLRPLLSAPSERSRDTSHLFDQQQFLRNCPTSEWPFFSYLFDTQLFCLLIEQRSFAHAESTALAFFDECTEKLAQDPFAQLINVGADVSRRSDLPTVVALPPDDVGLPKGKTYTYLTFPRLDPTLFHSAQSPLSRSPSFRCILPGSPMVGRRTLAEKTKDRMFLEKSFHSDSLWAKSLLSHVCSLWYMLLPSHLATHWNKLGVLSQAFELLEGMRKKQALPTDEVCYRILMEQCVKLGRPALAVRVYHEMIKAGLQPSAVTYGFYNKAVIEGRWPSTKRKWKILKIIVFSCLYLVRKVRPRAGLQQNGSRAPEMGEPDFSSLTRTTPTANRRQSSLSALDVGVDESSADVEGSLLHPLLQRRPSGSQHRGSVYKLSTNMQEGGDYAVRGDSSYVAEKVPRWSEGEGDERGSSLARGFWSSVKYGGGQASPKIRRLSRVVEPVEIEGPNLNLQITSCTQCPSCRVLLYDEQIMANWSSNEADYKTACPYCHAQVVASLTVVIKQTLPSVEGSRQQQRPSESGTIPEEDERTASPPTGSTSPTGSPDSPHLPLSRSKTWDRREATRLCKSKTVDSSCSQGTERDPKSEASPTENSLVGEQRGSGGRNSPSAQLDVGAIFSSPVLTPPLTDPLHRRAKGVGLDRERAGSDSKKSRGTGGDSAVGISGQTREESTSVSETVTGVSATESDILSSSDSGVRNTTEVNAYQRSEPPKQHGSNVDGNEAPKQSDSNVDILMMKPIPEQSKSSPHKPPSKPPSATADGSKAVSLQKSSGRDEPDLGVSGYIAQLRARGHRRSASAPIRHQPAPPPRAVEPPPTEGGSGERTTEKKPRYRTESSPPLVVPYLSPIVLRKEVESLMSQDGSHALQREELVRDRHINVPMTFKELNPEYILEIQPIMYWNLVWYFSRLQIPTYLPLLVLWGFTRRNQELRKHTVQMKVDLLWDSSFPGVKGSLYRMWLSKEPRMLQVHVPPTSSRMQKRDSEMQLQSLVARTQCGDLLPVLSSLLEDRQGQGAGKEEEQVKGVGLTPRSTYRETLFLKTVLADGIIDVELFEREYLQSLQRLPRELSSQLHPQDYLPTPRALQCRREFGHLQVD